MSSRAPISAAVTLLISCLVGPAAWAQAQNLEAGKSPSQLFAGACDACHKSPRGLLKTVSPASLSGFLREHYTTSDEMALQLATYLISNGASDSRQAKQGADKQGQGGNDQDEHQGRKNRNAPSQEAARPDDTPPPAEGGRQGPDGRRLSAKQRKKLSKPPGGEEPSLANEPSRTEPAKTEPPKTEPATAEPVKIESGTDDKAKVGPKQETGNAAAKADAEMQPRDDVKSAPAKSETPKSETAKTEAPADADEPVVRPDPVPPVMPAPPAAASTIVPAPAPTVASGGASEPAASQAPVPATAEPQAVTASAPRQSPAPPAPPISQ